MKGFGLGVLLTGLVVLTLFVYLHRFGRIPRHDATGLTEEYRKALAFTEETAVTFASVEDPELLAAVSRVQEAFTPFTVETVSKGFPAAYADEVYFRDAFHTFTALQPMLNYMIESAEMSPGVRFTFTAPALQGKDVYLPWTMILTDRRSGGEQHSIGLSRLRFNAEGKVVFHQDYWDSADVLVPRVPVANGLIEAVRRRF